MKYDYIIQNPPYLKNLHINIFSNTLQYIKNNSRFVIIQPATWLIALKENSIYRTNENIQNIRNILKNHVKKVIIENFNREFGTTNTVPFSITYIDFSNIYEKIEFICCGDITYVDSLDDCNLIGKHEIISSIFNKVRKFDVIKNHITNIQFDNRDLYYLQISNILWPVAGLYHQRKQLALSDTSYVKLKYGDYFQCFVAPTMHMRNDISNIIHKKAARGGSTKDNVKLTDNPASCIYGTYDELVNYKHYILNNKLPIFLNICLSIDQHNNSLDYVPYIIDKEYTDIELYKKFNLSENEILLIEKTIDKFERNSMWFKRYLTGK